MNYEELSKIEKEMEDATEEERWNKVLEYFPNFKLSTTKTGVNNKGANKYRVTVKNNNEKFTTTFTDSLYNTCKGIKSSNISILYCIIMDAQCYEQNDSLESFCSAFGYDLYEERSKAEKCYYGCEKQYNNIIKLFGNEGYEILSAITSQM